MYGVRCYNRCSRLRLLSFQHRLLLPLALLLLSHVRETEAFGALREFPPTERGNFTQLADHFRFNANGTFPQRYLVYDKFWSPASPGPILFYLGGEGSVENFYDSTSVLFTSLGPSLGGLLFFAEHRYYGTSIVEREILLGGGGGVKTGSAQMKKEQSLLTVEQALADFAGILHWFSTKMAKRVGGGGEQVVGGRLQRRETRPLSVFLFGGSYGGMLAGWFRVKYPHLSHGAVLSSAPVDFYPTAKEVAEAEDPEKANSELSRPIAVATEFWAAVLRTFELAGGPRCARALTEGIEALQGVACTELPLQPLTTDFLGFYPPETTTALAKLRRNCLLRFGTEVRPRELPLQFGPLARGGSMDGLRDAIIVDGELDPDHDYITTGRADLFTVTGNASCLSPDPSHRNGEEDSAAVSTGTSRARAAAVGCDIQGKSGGRAAV
eukprot:g5950.t1